MFYLPSIIICNISSVIILYRQTGDSLLIISCVNIAQFDGLSSKSISPFSLVIHCGLVLREICSISGVFGVLGGESSH